MVWFSCEDCGDSVKKPKLMQHFNQCSASRLTCIDCNRTMDRIGAKAHTTCVSEHEKYALGATKPGGKAAGGSHSIGDAANGHAAAAPLEATDVSFLAIRPPWRCSVCNVTCTSQETLLGHAGGAKHKRRAKAAKAAEQGAAYPAEQPVANSRSSPPDRPAENGSHSRAAVSQLNTSQVERSHKSKKRKIEEPSSSGEAATLDATADIGASQKRPKWKKLAAAALKAKGGRMSLSKLQEWVLKAAGVPKEGSADVAAEMLQRWQKSSQFVVANGAVRLA